MNQTETDQFFRLLHDLEDARAEALGMEAEELICQNPDYMEGYDYVMDEVNGVILEAYDVRNLSGLDYFVNRLDADANDYEGEYRRGYQEAVDLCLEAVNQLIESDEV
jgi:hypothetical protein